MKLHELNQVPLHSMLSEGRVDVNVLMSIRNIIRDGKITDHFQTAMLARIVEMMKTGQFYKETNFWEWQRLPTPKEIIDTLRALPPEVLVPFIQKVYDTLLMKDQDKFYQFVNPTQELLTWIYAVSGVDASASATPINVNAGPVNAMDLARRREATD